MNITELDSYRLADAVKFHNRLNPRLWDRDEQLLPEVRSKLLEIAADFQEFLGLSDLDVKDITLSGSNAAYSYTPHSDIDLHLVVNVPRDEVYQELFNAKKYQYNDIHNIKVRGADVELYVQPADEAPVSLGEYSIKNDQWIEVPKRKRAKIDQTLVRHKYEDLKARIESALKENDSERVQSLIAKIKAMRQAGLDQHGEFGPENLAFKMLRSQGWIKRLYEHSAAVKDRELSLKEEPKKPFKYGFGTDSGDYRSLFKPAAPKEPAANTGIQFNKPQDYEWYKQQQAKKKELAAEDAGETWDGVNPTTCMFLNEDGDNEKIVHEFIQWAADRIGIKNMPEIFIHADPEWSVQEHSFGRYEPESHSLHVNMANRHLFDILRTTAHELAHCKQNEDHTLPPGAGETGSAWENEAHAVAGIIMRDFADAHPELFDTPAISESASGYIPTKKQANDPRFSMALTVDIKPGQVGKEANKLKLKTDSQGHPGLLMKTANMIGESKINDLNDPLGPEFRPTMPRGTVRVDVSDVYDWYKLGKHMPDLSHARSDEFGKGPPSTIVSFGDEETEHKYIKNLEKLGLKTTDIDPKDPNQPVGMPRQSTDPTYNVDEEKSKAIARTAQDLVNPPKIMQHRARRDQEREQQLKYRDTAKRNENVDEDDLVESLRQEFALLEDEYLGEIKMSPTNLRQEAAKTGAQAGMEFEMIVPDVGLMDDGDMEPDYDSDESVRDIDDAVQFFHDGDWNGRREVQRLRDAMQQDYEDWIIESFDDFWADNVPELIRDYLEVNASDRDIAEILELDDEQTKELEDRGSSRQDYTAAAEKVIEDSDSSSWYDDARDEAQSEYLNDSDNQEKWLESAGIRTMQDVQNNYDINWPHWYNPSEGEADIDSVADDFSNAVGKPVNASQSYHGARREAGHYVVEPDGSLEGDNRDDAGLEFVSPPMPIDEMMSDLNKVKAWADSRGCYTNDSTGLHINISVPNFSLEKLDYVKLALLLGDKYVLDQYGRAGNTYCKAAIGKVQDKIKKQPDTAKAMLDKMRNGMEQLASKAIHSGTTDKYTSINTKDGYIEFRSPGGDWLNENFSKIENTLLRFTVALSAAMDPEAYRQEYLKKLYKLLEPTAVESNPDTIRYFADYVAGKTPKDALRSFVKQAQLERRLKKGDLGGEKYWWRVSNPQYSYGEIEVAATSPEEAIEKALGPDGYPSWASTRHLMVAKPIRPFDKSPVKAQAGEPQPVGRQAAQPPGRNYEIYRGQDNTDIVAAFVAADDQAAQERLERYRRDHPNGEYRAQRAPVPGSTVDLQRQRAAQQQTGEGTEYIIFKISDRSQLTGFNAANQAAAEREAETILRVMNLDPDLYDVRPRHPQQQPAPPTGAGREFAGWRVLLPSGEEVYRFSGVGNSQADANRIAAEWLRNNGMGVSGEGFEVVPVWREA